MGSARPIAIFSLLLFVTFAAVGSVRAGQHKPLNIEEAIKATHLVVPSGNEVQLVLFGVGYQVYVFNGTAWVNTNVSADLYNFKGFNVGHHFFLGEKDSNGGQPTWESFEPASRVTVKPLKTFAQDPENSVPWILFEATSKSGSSEFFGSVTFVQRLYTQDGLAPSANVPAKEGDVYESYFTTVYTFSTKNPPTTY